jgi:hypothetical protein
MAPLDERPQIGTLKVIPGSLDLDGVSLEAILREISVELTEEPPTDTPRHGWRVLDSRDGEVTFIGAPVDDDREWWRIGWIERGRGRTTADSLRMYPLLQPRRPSARERAGGLVLRWPEVTRSAPDLDLLAIDIVNTGAERWLPQGDSFVVFATLQHPGMPPASSSYAYVGGQNPALPLDPGEYARVSVMIDSSQWEHAHPGRYEVHPVLVDLEVHGTDPLDVDVTERNISDHLPQRPFPGS